MSDAPHYLVFETGGTKLVAAVAGPDRRIVESSVVYREPSDRAPKSFSRVLKAGSILHERHVSKGAQVVGIGFGFGGTVQRSTNSPHRCLHEDGWDEVAVVDDLEAQFGVPVVVENDCKLAALAEAHFGAGKGAETVFYVTLGTGVGGGLVHNGEIQVLGDIGEAEIGHVVVDPEGPPCWCGGRGCVEAVCSGPGISRLAEHIAVNNPDARNNSSLVDNVPLTSEELLSAWDLEDPFAHLVLEKAASHLATALSAAINLTAPNKVVIGGGFGTASSRFLDLVREKSTPLVVRYFRDRFDLVPASLGDEVVTQGAAILTATKVTR